jgi:hypothetical protein
LLKKLLPEENIGKGEIEQAGLVCYFIKMEAHMSRFPARNGI